MTAYFLIDTDIWIGLIANAYERTFLEPLEKLVLNNHIKLLIPETLYDEWKRKKQWKLGEMEKDFRKMFNIVAGDIIPPELNKELSEAKKIAETIDRLFDSGIQIKISKAVMVESMDRFRKNLPPFHTKKKSNDDSMIYFSALEYVRKNKIPELIFLSKNFTDFGHPEGQQKIHPLLANDKVEIKYYTSAEYCLYDLRDILPVDPSERSTDGNEYNIIDFNFGKEVSLLDQLDKVLKLTQEQITFLPLNILVRMTPFRSANGKDGYSHYSNFTIYTNNTLLVDFFRQIEIKRRVVKFKSDSEHKNTKANLQKIRFIIKSLNDNLVFEVGAISYGETVDLRLADKTECDCISCNYKNLQLEKVVKKLFEKNEEDKSQKAFIAYQLGFYGKALELYYDIYKAAVNKKQNILKYRMQLHLKWISGFTPSLYNKLNPEIIKEIKFFKMDKEFQSLFSSSTFDRQVSAFFNDNIFNYHYTTELTGILDNIRDNYDMQLRAGFSSNNNYWSLVVQYAEFESFIKQNCMPYTKYSDFQKLSALYIEGLFLSYALNEYQPSRLKYFTDFHLEQILFNGSPEKIVELYNHHVLKKIDYSSDSTQLPFQKIVINYFKGSAEFLALLPKGNVSRKTSELDHGKFFWNIVVLLTIIKFDKLFIKKCGEMILKYLADSENITIHNLKFLSSFIIQRGNTLGKSYLQRLLCLIINNPTLHNDSLFASFSLMVRSRPMILLNTNKDLDWVNNAVIEQCPKCGNSHFESLATMYSIISKPLQKKLQDTIAQKLEENFDHKLYYRASIYGIIDYRKHFTKYLEIFGASSKGWKDHPFFLAGEIDHPELSQLINLVFKNNIKLPSEFIERVKGYSDYYEWLLDLKNFDYEKFNPLWIIQFRTKYYLETIFKHKKVREKVKEFLRYNPQPLLAKDYVLYVG